MDTLKIKRFDYYKQHDKSRAALEKLKAHYVSEAAHLAGYAAPCAKTTREQAHLLAQAAYAMRQAASVDWYLKNYEEQKYGKDIRRREGDLQG